MKQTVQERAKEICEAWGMEDNHGYGVKDTFQAGFVQGANWQAKQSPWINVEERLPEENAGILFIVEWKDSHKGYFVGLYYGNGCWESEHRVFFTNSSLGHITHWMPIPSFNE